MPTRKKAKPKKWREVRYRVMSALLQAPAPLSQRELASQCGLRGADAGKALSELVREGLVVEGQFESGKGGPQYRWKARLVAERSREKTGAARAVEPATPVEYADFLIRWQHVHPDTRLTGVDGLRKVIGQFQGRETFQALFERDIFHSRVSDYQPAMLDRLIKSGEVIWRRFEWRRLMRAPIGFCFRRDQDWIVADPNEVRMQVEKWDDDLRATCEAVRGFLRSHGASHFDEIVAGTRLDWRLSLRAVWHLVWTGEATNESYESIRHANFTNGLSGCYDRSLRPGDERVTLDYIVKHILEGRKLDPRKGRWIPTARLVPPTFRSPDPGQRTERWARLLLDRWGVVTRDCLKHEIGTPGWRALQKVFGELELLGEVASGTFVEGLGEEQYASPEAVTALGAVSRLHAQREYGQEGTDPEPMILLNSHDPVSVFTSLLPTTNEAGEKVKFPRNPHNYLVVQAGQPLLLYRAEGGGRSVVLLADLARDRADAALRAMMQLVDNPPVIGAYENVSVRDWNGHPVDASPARHLLSRLGFAEAQTAARAWFYDGSGPREGEGTAVSPTAVQGGRQTATRLVGVTASAGLGRIDSPKSPAKAVTPTSRPPAPGPSLSAGREPEFLEREGKEQAPVAYDAEWIISRSPELIQSKLREFLGLLERILPEEYVVAYEARSFNVYYRDTHCISTAILRDRFRVGMGWRGIHAWMGRIYIDPETDLEAPEFIAEVISEFEQTRHAIDARNAKPPK